MPPDQRGWRLERFLEAMDAWIERESPSDDLRLIVIDWIMSRHDDPYRGMRRAAGYAFLWFGAVPGTQTDRSVVACSYWIHESSRTIYCNDIRALNQPM